MTATIDFALVVFGLALLFWAITASDKSVGHRALGGGIGFIALLVALLLRSGDEDHHHRGDWS
jgi:hypothetical protein